MGRWQGWPEGDATALLMLPATPELVNALATSADYHQFRTELHNHFSGTVVEAVKRRRGELQR